MPFASPPVRDDRNAALHFEQWRRRQAQKQYARYVRQHSSADAYKDDPHRSLSPSEFAEDRLRATGRGEALSQKKASIKRRWALPRHANLIL